MTLSEPLPAEYILPLRWADDTGLDELLPYLEQLCSWIRVTVVDGSAPDLFDGHQKRFPASVRHIRPAPGAGGNGKVAAVMTAVRLSSADKLVIADDDVRFTHEGLTAVIAALDHAHVVRPQNFFSPLPWHACWDTARTLINRAFADDFPGTLAVRRDALLATDGYDGVLFENLELIRTVTAAGGLEKRLPALFIARRPPASRHFLRQRIRQAYDSFAQPGRLCAELTLAPLLTGVIVRAPRLAVPAVLGSAVVAVILAEVGRRRHRGRGVFPPRTILFAPLWVAERALCSWIALVLRIGGGVPYAGIRLKTAAHSPAELRTRHAGRIAAASPHPSVLAQSDR